MRRQSLEKRLAAHFDGEHDLAQGVPKEVLEAPENEAYLASLGELRQAAREEAPAVSIGDDQFPAFMARIREEVEAPAHHRPGGYRTALSLALAAMLLAFATMLLLRNGPPPVGASEVEWVTTDVEGATVGYDADADVTTIWIQNAGDDI